MFKSYFTIAFRNLIRHKAFSFINIFGLSIGMACSILILLWVQNELSYDRFHRNADKIYRVTVEVTDIKAAVTVAPLAEALKATLPGVKNTVILGFSQNLFQVEDRKFEEKRGFYADSNFLQVFTFPLVKGDPKTALSRPDGVLITEEMATKYFGQQEAMGKTIRLNNQDNVVVTGILANIPANSHLQFNFILPIAFLARNDNNIKNKIWDNFNYFTYVEFNENVDASIQQLNSQINNIYKAHESNLKAQFQLQPLINIHLHSKLIADVAGHGNIQYVRIFSIVAIFILVVACINFMNLATARSARRAKEVGLRKVVGARRNQLIWQFLGESSLIAGLALLLALFVVWLLLPAFNDLSGKQLAVNILDGKVIFGLISIALLTGLLSGSYPALFLSSFQPVKVLKGTLKLSGVNVWFRNGLVVAQFVVSIILVIGTLVVFHQLHFIKNKNLGFEKENLIYVQMNGMIWQHYQALRTELGQNRLTSDFAVTADLPTNLANVTESIQWEGKDPNTQPLFSKMAVDENFIDVFKIELLEGRSFSKEFKADTANFIVNEKALQAMGMHAATAVGKPLTFTGVKGTIIGVVKDFNFKPIQQPIEPLILQFNTWGGMVVVKTKPGTTEATINELKNIFQKLNPQYPFAYNFLDQDLNNLYQAEQRMSSLFNAFAVLGIFISCLGLYGLSAFIAEQRTKEIGVRKVLGASVGNITLLLSSDFLKLVAIAFIIASPIAWYAMNKWLENFAFHIEMGLGIFLLAGAGALLIALGTVSFQSVKAAIMNPVKSLRNE